MELSPVTCDDVERSSYVERFLARTLSEHDSERFESHFLTCDRCQQALTVGAATRASFRHDNSVTTLASNGARQAVPVARASPAWRWGIPMSTAAAVLIGVFGYRAHIASSRALEALGAVTQAPVYLGVSVRASNDERGIALFDSAMIEYSAQRWEASARGLRAAIAAGKSDAPAHFFLGAALLMLGEPREAVAEFSGVIALPPSPYTNEARLYRAKAHVQLHAPKDAMSDLTRILQDATTSDDAISMIAAYARALRDSIQATGVR